MNTPGYVTVTRNRGITTPWQVLVPQCQVLVSRRQVLVPQCPPSSPRRCLTKSIRFAAGVYAHGVIKMDVFCRSYSCRPLRISWFAIVIDKHLDRTRHNSMIRQGNSLVWLVIIGGLVIIGAIVLFGICTIVVCCMKKKKKSRNAERART